MKLLVIVCAIGLAAGTPNIFIPGAVTSSFHAQDELGQYSYGYAGGPSAKHETRTLDGVTRGGYSYVDSHGLVQSAAYVADPVNGFRVAATNLPVGPAVPAAPGLVAAHTLGAPALVAAAHGLLRKRRSVPLVGHGLWHAPLTNAWAVDGHDTPAVAAAKVAHSVAHTATAVRDAWGHAGVYSAGAPLAAAATAGDTFPVAAAKVAHADAHARTTFRDATLGHWNGWGVYASGAPVLHLADTPSVTAAKVAHGAAHVDANVRLAHAHAHGLPLWRKRRSAVLGLHGLGVVAPVTTQFHAQDALGQYNYGYVNGNSAKQEVRAADGSTVGAYSYVDGHGLLQSVNYAADANGFRVAATNLPHATSVVASPLVHAAAVPAVHWI